MKPKQKQIYRKDASLLLKDAQNPRKTSVKILDGWMNVLTGLGRTHDKSIYTNFMGYTVLDDLTLSEIWVGDGFGKRIIEVVADDMTREWLDIENDIDNVITDKIYSLRTESLVNLALKWKRLFGGSLIVMGIDDGVDIEDPVNMNRIKNVNWLKVFDRTDVAITTVNFQADVNEDNFGEVEFFTVSPRNGTPFNVHHSRVMVFKGTPVPNRITVRNLWYWGMSELQPIWNELKDFGAGKGNINKLLYEFVIGKFKLKGLAKKLAEKDEEAIRARMNIISLSKSMINAVLLDADGNEDFIRDSANVAGMADLLDRMMMFLAGVSGIPVTRLFGRSPAGQNSTGESDLMNYYDMIVPKQKNEMQPQLQKLIDYINLSSDLKSGVENPTIHFNKLFQLTETQEIENRKKQAEIDHIYIGDGVYTAEDVAGSRFDNGYNFETIISEGGDDDEEDLTVVVPKE